MISIFDVLIQAAMLVFGAVFVVLAVAVGTKEATLVFTAIGVLTILWLICR